MGQHQECSVDAADTGRRARRLLRVDGPPPSFFERARSAAWVAPLRALPAIAAGVLLYGALDALDLLFPPWGRAVGAVLKAIIVYSALSALIYAVLAPRSPQWRLVALADAPTRRIGVLLCAITAVYAIDGALTEISRVFFVPLPVPPPGSGVFRIRSRLTALEAKPIAR